MSDTEENLKNHEEDVVEDAPQDWGSINKNTESLLLRTDLTNFNDESLPSRSEKYFDQDGSDRQRSSLADARNQMLLALSHVRGHHVKQLLVGVWIPQLQKALVPHAKGSFFKDMGSAHNFKNKKKLSGMWLNSIETVYLTERGSLIMYLANDQFMSYIDDEAQSFDYETLTQLTLSHLYALAFQTRPELLDKYQVYALLKRLGYLVLDHKQHLNQQQLNGELKREVQTSFSWLTTIKSAFANFGSTIRGLLQFSFSRHFFNYTEIFQSLRLIPTYSADTLNTPFPRDPRYRIVFNVWKPSPAFSKKNPPVPDFHLGILNTAEVPFPNLRDIQNSWSDINLDLSANGSKSSEKTVNAKKKNQPLTKKEIKLQRRKERESQMNPKLLSRNNYLKLRDQKLKSGSTGRSVVFAIIDNGVVNFTSFNETEFELSSHLSTRDLDLLEKRDMHGIIWNEKLAL